MGKNKNKQQQRKAQKEVNRKLKRKMVATPKTRSLVSQIHTASKWPLLECHIADEWQQNLLGNVIVSRRGPNAEVTVASFLLDFGCLGVKDVWVHADVSLSLYKEKGAINSPNIGDRIEISPDDALKLIDAARAYGESLGFPAPKLLIPALRMLGDADATKSALEVECGKDGKPLWVPGPADNVPFILEHLNKTLGPDGFNYIAEIAAGSYEE